MKLFSNFFKIIPAHAWVILIFSLLAVQYLYNQVFYPPFLYGEEYSAIQQGSQLLECFSSNEISTCLKHEILRYNKGYSWLIAILIPISNLLNLNTIDQEIFFRYFLLVLPLLFISLSIFIFAQCQQRHWLLSVISSIFLCVVLVSIRRYKWHSLCILASTSPIFFSFYLEDFKKKYYLIASILILLITTFFYTANVFYIFPILFVLFIYTLQLPPGSQLKNKLSLLFIISVLIGTGLTLYLSSMPDFKNRLIGAYEWSIFHRPDFLERNIDSTINFFKNKINLVSAIIYFIGITRLIHLSFTDKKLVHKSILFLNIYVFTFLFITEGLFNLEFTNFYYMSFLLAMMYGASITLTFAKKIHSIMFIAIAVILVINSYFETKKFHSIVKYTYYQGQSEDYQTQAAVALYYIQSKLQLSKKTKISTCHLFPSEKVSITQGGFKYEQLKRHFDYYTSSINLNFFDDISSSQMPSFIKNHQCQNATWYFNSNYKNQIPEFLCMPIYPFGASLNNYYSIVSCILK